MTRTRIVPTLAILVLCLSLPVAAYASKRKAKPAAKPAAKSARATKNARAAKGREQVARGRDRGAKAKASARGSKAPARETRAERRQRLREERAAARDTRRGGRKMSKRERLLQARREAEARRRAELARLAAIARARAIEQALRNEVANNIANDDPTGEDLEVRRAAVAAVGNRIASVVVMDPKTGRVYTIVNQEWGLRRGFKPCSTTKLITALAGLSEHVIDPVQEASFIAASTHRPPDLTSALAFSTPNSYFQNVSGRVGFERMISYARQLGYGERTGINHVNEYAGRLPLFKTGYAVNHMGSHGDDFEVTPLQLAGVASVFANGGTLLVPHLPRTPEESVKFQPEVRRQLNIPQEVLRRMLPGMVGAVAYGSGRKAFDPTQTIAGKTGTCIQSNGWVGLFTSYAPVEDPQLAIAVVGRGPDARQHIPVWIAGQIYKQLAHRFGKRGNRPAYTVPTEILKPQPRLDAATAIAAGDEDAEEKEAAAEATADGVTVPEEEDAADERSGKKGEPVVRRVLQPVPTNPNGSLVQPAAVTPRPAAKPAPTPARQSPPAAHETRPRRVNPNEQP
jgi:membrane peptidoglycan carboxypeptidase